MKKNPSIIYGIIAAIYYAIVVWVRYTYFDNNLPAFSLASIIGYVILILFLVFVAFDAKKRNGDVAEIKLMFQSMFIVIVFAEVSFAVMNYAYLFQINPAWIDQYYENNVVWTREHSKWPEERKQEVLQSILASKEASVPQTLMNMMRSIISDSIFAFIIAFIIKQANKKITLERAY